MYIYQQKYTDILKPTLITYELCLLASVVLPSFINSNSPKINLKSRINPKINQVAAGDMGGQWMDSTRDHEFEEAKPEKGPLEEMEEAM